MFGARPTPKVSRTLRPRVREYPGMSGLQAWPLQITLGLPLGITPTHRQGLFSISGLRHTSAHWRYRAMRRLVERLALQGTRCWAGPGGHWRDHAFYTQLFDG